jgi:hypothetical protein
MGGVGELEAKLLFWNGAEADRRATGDVDDENDGRADYCLGCGGVNECMGLKRK